MSTAKETESFELYYWIPAPQWIISCIHFLLLNHTEKNPVVTNCDYCLLMIGDVTETLFQHTKEPHNSFKLKQHIFYWEQNNLKWVFPIESHRQWEYQEKAPAVKHQAVLLFCSPAVTDSVCRLAPSSAGGSAGGLLSASIDRHKAQS